MARVLNGVCLLAALVAVSVSGVGARSVAEPGLALKVRELFDMLELLQVKQDRPFIGPGLWQEDRGIYPSYVRLNFVGSPPVAEMRNLMSVFDNNMFATAWITSALLEAHHYTLTPRPSDQQLLDSLDAIGAHHDRNVAYNSSVMSFWPLAWDSNSSMWVNTPANLLHALDVFSQLPWDAIDKELEKLGWKELEEFLKRIVKSKAGYERVFKISPDFDDTFVNLGLGALLKDMGDSVPEPLARWTLHNSNLTSVLDALRRYAYRPFHNNSDINTLDTRAYYYMRYFLNDAAQKGLDVALVPTWAQSISEARKYYHRGVVMPLQVNNVDITVAANAIYGITASVLSGLLPPSVLDPHKDPEIAQVYHNTSTMIAFMIRHQFFGRPDLALTYYPSVFEFYWFVARTLHRMEMALHSQPLPKLMQEMYTVLKGALQGPMTKHVTSTGTEEGGDMKYYDDFLGDADVDAHNKTEMKAEDRLYTTTMAVNALLTTWTLTNTTSKTVTWRPGTPQEVKDTTSKAVKWLNTHILGLKYKPWNAFFSGSFKGTTTSPLVYPGNRLETLNGTRVSNYRHVPKDFFLFGVEGLIPEEKYEALVKNTSMHFGRKTPTEFVSFNDPHGYFPFWSSPAYTYATSMVALGRYDKLMN
ncbi:uncharacterized protein LOC143297295 [Babylonia areolata]|uniref:uncharacterized protein LOC143297295 n=1 Tax=Babylonia areolata TaxID=304850 RepID=UPI003FD07709